MPTILERVAELERERKEREWAETMAELNRNRKRPWYRRALAAIAHALRDEQGAELQN